VKLSQLLSRGEFDELEIDDEADRD